MRAPRGTDKGGGFKAQQASRRGHSPLCKQNAGFLKSATLLPIGSHMNHIRLPSTPLLYRALQCFVEKHAASCLYDFVRAGGGDVGKGGLLFAMGVVVIHIL